MYLAVYFVSFLIFFPFNIGIIHPQVKLIHTIEVKKVLGKKIEPKVTPTPTIIPITLMPTIDPTAIPINTATPTPGDDKSAGSSASWGQVKQIDNHTYSIRINNDSQMATSQEILTALNNYRSAHGAGVLFWDNNLGNFAQSRADQFNNQQKLDDHAGFNQLFNDPNNVKKLGFLALGENSSVGYILDGIHIIEWVYASDAPHNNNQLDPSWTHVGIGVSGNATDLVFGGSKI